MFLWLKVPKIHDTWDMILERALTKNVILVPGKAFMCDSSKPSQYMRAAFSIVSPENMDKVGYLHLLWTRKFCLVIVITNFIMQCGKSRD
ncbi:Kynurenine/alpha-aminoadipate aminotransferase, mitochondrial [Portunus trituberculatus]|uniref:Kynurenine/alpha-aminoadipate aminotransferase, mitochondrial n=1 Tax=Portunus trituberculatus TaxID=210409 RepID=A0A5B7GBM3_PORTR|nr:Kynurenine/alpha-aminoadipate aminotransferase, mitochondrial [Portunus trituberculatus]